MLLCAGIISAVHHPPTAGDQGGKVQDTTALGLEVSAPTSLPTACAGGSAAELEQASPAVCRNAALSTTWARACKRSAVFPR